MSEYEYRGNLWDCIPKTGKEAMGIMDVNPKALMPPTEEELQRDSRILEKEMLAIHQAQLYETVVRHNQNYDRIHLREKSNSSCKQQQRKEVAKRHKKNKNKKTHRKK